MKYGALILLATALTIAACKKKPLLLENEPPDSSTSIDEYVGKLQSVKINPAIASPTEIGRPLATWDKKTSLYCTSKKYKLGPAYNEGFLLDPATDVIFPGAILDGNSIYDGGYRLVSLARTGGTISTDNTAATQSFTKVNKTVKSEVQQGLIDLLSNTTVDGTAAQINFSIDEMKSQKQLDIAFGFSIDAGKKGNLNTTFAFGKKDIKSRVLIKFQQIYYTVTYDAKNKPSEYFTSSVTASDVYNAIDGTSIAPVYVSNVRYGRIGYYAVTSNLTTKELKATLDAQIKKATVSASVDAALTTKLEQANTNISGTIIGGNGNDAVSAVSGLDGFYKWIAGGGSHSATSPGLPVGYTLRRLSDNGVFTVQKNTEYTVRECREVKGAISLNSMKHVAGSMQDHVLGNVVMTMHYDDSTVTNPSPNQLWQVSKRIDLPKDEEKPITNPATVDIAFSPKRFNTAYMNITVDLDNSSNEFNSSDFGDNQDVQSYWAIATKKATYKIYLKDIVNTQALSAPWSTNDGQVFHLSVDVPEGSVYANFCTGRKWCACTKGACNDRYNGHFYRKASTIKMSFAINVIAPGS